MRSLLIFISFVCWFAGSMWVQAQAQTVPDYELIVEINKKTRFITIDKLGCIYTCDGNTLEKYNENGEFLYSYAALSTGRISFIDVFYPLKTLVFFKDFIRMLFLDTKLAPQQTPYNLSALDLYFPTCVCASYDNGFWVYDESLKQLFRYDAQQNVSNKSQILTALSEKDINPLFIKESESGFLLVNDTANGLFIFDRFGAYLKTIPVYTDYFHVRNQQIMYVKHNLLQIIDVQNLRQMSIPLPEEDVRQACIEHKRMVILTKDYKVKIYTVGLK
jgi:hypothetical protein